METDFPVKGTCWRHSERMPAATPAAVLRIDDDHDMP
jgi:hypothetical protein